MKDIIRLELSYIDNYDNCNTYNLYFTDFSTLSFTDFVEKINTFYNLVIYSNYLFDYDLSGLSIILFYRRIYERLLDDIPFNDCIEQKFERLYQAKIIHI